MEINGSFFERGWMSTCVRDRRTESNKDRQPHWPISSSLDHITLCYLPCSTWHFFCFSTMSTQPETWCRMLPQRSVQPLAGSLHDWPNLFWKRAETDTRLRLSVFHEGICIYNFLTTTLFRSTTWLISLIFTSASCAENLWVTAPLGSICNTWASLKVWEFYTYLHLLWLLLFYEFSFCL